MLSGVPRYSFLAQCGTDRQTDRQTLLDLEVNHNITTPLVVFAALSLSVEIYQPNIVTCALEMYEVKSARIQCHTNDSQIPRYQPSSQQRGS